MPPENESTKEIAPIHEKTTLEILKEAPHLTIRDPQIYKRLEETLYIINPVTPEPILDLLPEQSMSLNSSHIIHMDRNPDTGMPRHTIKLVSPERRQNRQREFDWLRLMNANGVPTGNNGRVTTPELDAEKSTDLSLVLSYEFENLSKSANIEDFLARIEDYLDMAREIKPTDRNKGIFPHESTRNLDTPNDSLGESLDRIGLFEVFKDRLTKNQIDETLADDGEANALLKEILDDRISERVQQEITEIKVRFKDELDQATDQSLVCIDSGDLNPENFNYRLIGGESSVSVHDGEYAQFQSQLYSVAYFINHPRLRNLFSDQATYKATAKKFLVDFARRAKLNEAQVNQLNTYVATSHVFWEATLLKTVATGRKNFREISGGIYKSRLEAVRDLDYPLVVRMLDEGAIEPITQRDISETSGLSEIQNPVDFVQITSPLGDKYPTTRHQRWAGEVVGGKIKKWFKDIKLRFQKKGIKPESDGEIANNPPYLLGEVEDIVEVSNQELYLAIQKFGSYYTSQRRGDRNIELTGRYGYLVESEKKRDQEGNLFFVTTEEKIPDIDEDSKPPFVLKQEIIEKIKMGTDFADELCENLSHLRDEKQEGQKEITDVTIIDQNKQYFTIVVLRDDEGNEFPVVLYRTNKNRSAGGAYVVKDGNEYQLIENRRVIIPEREDQKTDSKTVVETYRDFFEDDSAVAQETGMKAYQYRKRKIANVRHDATTDLSATNMYVLERLPRSQWKEEPSASAEYQDPADDLETINRGIRLSGRECVESFGNLIKDPMTTIALTLTEIEAGRLLLDTDLQNTQIVMEKKYDLASAGFIYGLVNGPRDTGEEIGTIFNDTGKSRLDRKISNTDLDTIISLTPERRLVTFSAKEVLDMIKVSKFDDVTAASIIIGMVNNGLLKPR